MPKPANGLMCCGPGLFTTAALILCLFAYGCHFVKLSDDNLLRTAFQRNGEPTPDTIGLWCYRSANGANEEYPDGLDWDTKWNSARGMQVVATIIGVILWLFYLVAACLPFGTMLFMCAAFFLLINTLFQGLVFLVFRSDACNPPDGVPGSCKLDTGANCCIAATCLWFCASLLSCIASKDAGRDRGGDDDEGKREAPAEEVEEKAPPDVEEGGEDKPEGEDKAEGGDD